MPFACTEYILNLGKDRWYKQEKKEKKEKGLKIFFSSTDNTNEQNLILKQQS